MKNADPQVEKKTLNPAGEYNDPEEVLGDTALSRDEKIAILRAWRYDALRLQESAAENMSGGEPDRLHAVSQALLKLGVSPAKEADPTARGNTNGIHAAKRLLKNYLNAIRGSGQRG